MDSYPRGKPGPVVVRFTVSAANAQEATHAVTAPRLPIDRTGTTFTKKSNGKIHENNGAIWLVKPNTLTWSHLTPPVTGRYRIRFELRHSESSPEGTDLQDAYELRIDGRVVPLEWIKLNTWHTGNAYFGHAVTPPLDLSKRARTIEISTKKTWCAVRGGFHIGAEE